VTYPAEHVARGLGLLELDRHIVRPRPDHELDGVRNDFGKNVAGEMRPYGRLGRRQRREDDASPRLSRRNDGNGRHFTFPEREDGYAREMEWRAEEASLDSLRARSTQHVRWTRDALRRLSDRHAAHCLYRVEKDRVVRWTAYRGQVVREILPLEFEDLARRPILRQPACDQRVDIGK
jgi:hypothetical protein